MNLSAITIEDVVHPTAAFSPDRHHGGSASSSGCAWPTSLLNPKNRIDSLDIPIDPLWRIDGCTGLGTQYYTVPLFLSKTPPMRIDVFIPENQPEMLHQQLDLGLAFHIKDGVRLSRLAIARHIIRALDMWVRTKFKDLEAFERFYLESPFGTRIVFEELSLDIHKIRITVGLNHNLEPLMGHWGSDFEFPQIIDINEVEVVKVLHDSVCLSRIHGQLYIFKALTSGSKYLYHELKILCTLKPHPNVISRPIHIVRKTCKFGGKKAIVGFTTFFHKKGSLRDYLPQLRIHDKLDQGLQLKWCIQLTSALEWVRATSGTYYPDLRLDNIVLSEDSDIVMVDFEQRGVWCEFAAPEVNSIEYIRLLATDEDVSNEVQDNYKSILSRLVPQFETLEGSSYSNPPNGYNITWIALSPIEQEAAEVFMLGRALWCIFEGVSGPQKAAVWQSYPWESDLEFPEFRRTPTPLRSLIDRCTRGRRLPLWGQMVLKGMHSDYQTAKNVQDAARQFWKSELQIAEDFLSLREAQKAQGSWKDNYYERPTVKEVLSELRAYQHAEGYSNDVSTFRSAI
ncbi:hypothetical protein BX600DRAFT_479712 [Xylariales sp. PMI_506]|nr:hypothetical protein BX600DRAFT_479712 [Xylariales sp. PMI_506]